MASYKVIQDIEAEDKLIGPLTLRQAIYAAIAAVAIWFSYLAISKHAVFLLVLFVPFVVFGVFFAFPWSHQQTTEVWALARIRFILKPRRRTWDQDGVKQLVTITAPRVVEQVYTNGLSQSEVQSRLRALADTIDSRGWAIKNASINMAVQPAAASDRLVDISSLPREVPGYDVRASDDIMDEQSNPVAQQFDQMITASAQAHHQQIVSQLSRPQTVTLPAPVPTAQFAPGQPQTVPADYWFLNPPAGGQGQPSAAVIAPGTAATDLTVAAAAAAAADEQALGQHLKARSSLPTVSYAHLRHIQPLSDQAQAGPAAALPQVPVTPPPHPAILGLANNNDLNVATIARQAHKHTEEPPDEVVISLH